jgi:hypothetical protein
MRVARRIPSSPPRLQLVVQELSENGAQRLIRAKHLKVHCGAVVQAPALLLPC